MFFAFGYNFISSHFIFLSMGIANSHFIFVSMGIASHFIFIYSAIFDSMAIASHLIVHSIAITWVKGIS